MLNRPADGTDVGETVASVRDYESAQKAVSKLIADDVPARDIAIVGQSVRTIERVTGRLGYATAARSGAINGVLIGLLLSAILVLGQPDMPIQLFVGFVLIGVAIGMLLSLVTFAIVRRRRDFASVTQLAADHYEVTVKASSLAKARGILGVAARTAPARPPVDLNEPPRYGERIDPAGAGAGAAAGGGAAAGSALSATGADAGASAASSEPIIPPRPADPPPRYGERITADVPASAVPTENSGADPASGGHYVPSGDPLTGADPDSGAEAPASTDDGHGSNSPS